RHMFYVAGSALRIAIESELAIVVGGLGEWTIRRILRHTCVRKMRVVPGKLAVEQAGGKGDVVAGVLRNIHAEMDRVRRAGWDQAHVNRGTGGPSIALVDDISRFVDLH